MRSIDVSLAELRRGRADFQEMRRAARSRAKRAAAPTEKKAPGRVFDVQNVQADQSKIVANKANAKNTTVTCNGKIISDRALLAEIAGIREMIAKLETRHEAQRPPPERTANAEDAHVLRTELQHIKEQMEQLRLASQPSQLVPEQPQAEEKATNPANDQSSFLLLTAKLRSIEEQEQKAKQSAQESLEQAQAARAQANLIELRNKELAQEVDDMKRQLQGVKLQGREEVERITAALSEARGKLTAREAEERGAQAALQSVRLQIAKLIPSVNKTHSKTPWRHMLSSAGKRARTPANENEAPARALGDLRGLLDTLRVAKASVRAKEAKVRKSQAQIATLGGQLISLEQVPLAPAPGPRLKELRKELRNARGSLVRVAESTLQQGAQLQEAIDRIRLLEESETSESESLAKTEKLRALSKTCKDTNEALARKLDALQATRRRNEARFEQEMANVSAAVARTKASASTKRSEAARLVSEQPGLEHRIATLYAEIEDAEAALRTSEERTASLSFRAESLARMNEHLGKDPCALLDILERKTTLAAADARAAQEETAEVKAQLSAATGRGESLRSSQQDVTREVRGLYDEAERLRAQLTELAEKATGMASSAAKDLAASDASGTQGNSESKLAWQLEERARLKDALSVLRERLRHTQAQESALQEETDELRAAAKRMGDQTRAHAEQLNDLETVASESDALRGRVVSLSREARESQLELGRLLDLETRHKAKFDAINARLAQLHKLVQNLQQRGYHRQGLQP
ncbi:Hypothetical Protein FCC1311_050242 [Hondaea fermentalgiana]|uniref:Uncharacterized protein n=1 Tax=Hondaea fermentalgiana TaxID=2315210 RepID=A0A2R5GJG6_9STRA|nr:Hypothetical Protein FCC1311_050242 [Hondaea fermentalgiana]|eukprot:GBG28803.1 Hypothetical Protein FCC1311_050242 [Hondaea fermentalgiana]